MSTERESLKGTVPEFGKYGTKLDKAVDAVLTGGVKEIRFMPSGRRLIIVVGRLGDEFVDPEKPYCSCSNFYFRVSGKGEETCYHLLSYKIAMKAHMLDTVEFSDDEFGPYLAATVRDVFYSLGKSG